MTTQPTNKTQDIIFILDESGSMDSMGNEPVQAVNSFVAKQKEAVKDEATFTLWKFNNHVTKVYDDVPLSEVPEFADYKPDSMTALFDAIGMAIDTKKTKGKIDGVVCVILTDGKNNASRKYTATSIKALIKEMETEHNWSFIFLGANQDAFEAGGDIGVRNCANFDCCGGGLTKTCNVASAAVAAYRTSSQKDPNAKLEAVSPMTR